MECRRICQPTFVILWWRMRLRLKVIWALQVLGSVAWWEDNDGYSQGCSGGGTRRNAVPPEKSRENGLPPETIFHFQKLVKCNQNVLKACNRIVTLKICQIFTSVPPKKFAMSKKGHQQCLTTVVEVPSKKFGHQLFQSFSRKKIATTPLAIVTKMASCLEELAHVHRCNLWPTVSMTKNMSLFWRNVF